LGAYFLSASTGAAVAEPNEVLAKQLTAIRADNRSGNADPNELGMRCLKLIQDHNSPAEKGMIYATAAFIHSEKGFGRPSEREGRLAKTIEYANEALKYPLDVHTACRLYGYLGDALALKGRNASKDIWLHARQEAVGAWLKGLALALDNGAPREMPAPPLVTGANVFAPDGRRLEETARREEQKAARTQYERCDTFTCSVSTDEPCATLCSQKPLDVDQFRVLALRILDKHPDAVNELVQEVEARIETSDSVEGQPLR
jgi:hypothetical protein